MELPLIAMPKRGTAVQVITTNDDHSFTLNESALKEILLDRRVKDSKVIVLSIAGAFRKGKSFLLNFFLRYLNAQGAENWIGDEDATLQGFGWKVGPERNTTGILMWSDPFEVKLATGEKVFVLLMDTQGTFDNKSTVKDCATIFALSTILSSVQIYNVKEDILENDLQYLQFFVAYGQMALEKCKSKPFQSLYFLVRDFQWPYNYNYGLKGGEKFLNKRLEMTGNQHDELMELRRHLYRCFAKIGCCLLPHPGKKAATCQDFCGLLSDIEDDFKLHVKELVSSLLSPDSLVIKEFNGTQITGKELFEYFKAYTKIFQGNKLPELKSMYEATAEINNQSAVSNANDYYKEHMDKICGSHKKYVKKQTLNRKHQLYRGEAIERFRSIPKMGGDEKSRDYQKQLEQKIEESFENYIALNLAKKKLCCCINLNRLCGRL